jgi:hypothetical protein
LHPADKNKTRQRVFIYCKFRGFIHGTIGEQAKVQKKFWPQYTSRATLMSKIVLYTKSQIMKTNTTIILGLFILIGISSCSNYTKTDVVGSGDVVSMEVEVGEFMGVSVTGECHVNILIGEAEPAVLSAQQEILDVMTYEVKNNILQIGFKQGVSVNTDKKIRADIVIPEASYVAVTGAGDFHLEGTGQERLDIYITGAGNVSAFDMEVDDCQIRISGTANCEVSVRESLYVQVSGVGNIFYKGSPSLNSDISGVGNVTEVGE